MKPGILKLTVSKGQRNLRAVFIFVSCEEKSCYRIVSFGHQNFDCRSYCGLSHRMQGKKRPPAHAASLLTMYHRLKFKTKFSPIRVGLNQSRDAIVFIRGDTLSAHRARPKKIPGWIVRVRENISVN